MGEGVIGGGSGIDSSICHQNASIPLNSSSSFIGLLLVH